jgi:hypothetical protein
MFLAAIVTFREIARIFLLALSICESAAGTTDSAGSFS